MQLTLFVITLFCSVYLCKAYYDDWILHQDDVSHIDHQLDDNALDTFRNIQKKSFKTYRRRVCRRWNHHCVPWTNRPGFKCCGGLSCKCNLWMQNCRCVSRLWGR